MFLRPRMPLLAVLLLAAWCAALVPVLVHASAVRTSDWRGALCYGGGSAPMALHDCDACCGTSAAAPPTRGHAVHVTGTDQMAVPVVAHVVAQPAPSPTARAPPPVG